MENLKDAETRKNNKSTNPYTEAGILKKLVFGWMFPLFYKGYKYGLSEDDIFPHLSTHDSEILGDQLEREWNKEVRNHKEKASLWRAFARLFGLEMMFYGLGILLFEMIRLTQPLILAKLLEYFEPNTTMTSNQAYLYAALISCVTLAQMILIHHAIFHIIHMGMRLRVASVALVYRKAIRLSKSALAETTIGQMVNLISNDVSRFETCTINVHDMWIGPIQLIILLFLLHSYAGWPGLTGLGVLVCVIPFQMWMGKKTSVYRLRTALRTDERIRLMNEIISGMQVIKMYTWEKPFTKIVETVRRLEMKEIRKNSIIRAIHASFNLFLTRLLIYSCIVVYILTGNTINPQYVFGLSLFYELARQVLSQAFSQGVTQLAEAIISTRRIKQFLLYEEVKPEITLNPSGSAKCLNGGSTLLTPMFTESSKPVGINLNNISTRWINSNSDYSLDDITFNVSAGELATVIGKVGSGKSTLLHVILKELPPLTGTVSVTGSVAYASQEPWLFVGSIRQNILFGQELDLVKYHEVVRVCALERDFTLFPHGDRTIIGERGVSLSGGQKARINLARAIYKEADIYLLDDPLSAVDAHVGKQIFRECIQGYLNEKCVVLVTHQLQHLRDCKKIYLLNHGKVQHSGSYEEIENSGKEFTKLLEDLRKMEEEKETEEVRKRKRTMSAQACNEENLEEPTFAKETKIEGKVTWKMYKTYFLAGGNVFKILSLVCLFLFSQALASGVDYFLSIWVNTEQIKPAKINDTVIRALDNDEYLEFHIFWSDILMTEKTTLLIYTGLVLVITFLMISRGIYFFHCCISASTNLHNNMFANIVYAPMRFFNLNPSGRILNRFSKDMNQVDEYLPVTFSDTLLIGLMASATIVVVATVVPFILIPTGFILVIFYCIRIVFIATSRDIKRFEAITRSPIYSHLTASLQGLTTIRAFGAQKLVKKEFDNYQDAFSSAYFMFLAANRTFGFWLDLHTIIFVTLVTFGVLFFKTDAFGGGSAGLAITQAIGLAGWFQYGIRQWSETENTMTSVERVKEYADVEQEIDSKAKEPPRLWPESGTVKFDDVSLRYAKTEPYVLKNLSFAIESTEKVGIVGRTGAGKSSVIAALFRLADIDGAILIDNIDSQTVPLDRLRSCISIIPQEPVLFSGTLRKNLDPFDEYNDDILWDALEQVELKPAVSELPHGLESKISEGGANFSVGQRQLVCLARAVVRKNRILVLDEATANVDPHTDDLIQKTIRVKFAHCTVLTIAHRLHTIMDSDKVLVMDAGRVVEFDHPHSLLQNEGGIFYSLVQQTGRGMAANLSDIAHKTYQSRI